MIAAAARDPGIIQRPDSLDLSYLVLRPANDWLGNALRNGLGHLPAIRKPGEYLGKQTQAQAPVVDEAKEAPKALEPQVSVPVSDSASEAPSKSGELLPRLLAPSRGASKARSEATSG